MRLFTLSLLSIALLSGCGGSGSESDSGSNPGSTSGGITPNRSVNETSSHALQSSDLYIAKRTISTETWGNFVHAVSYADFDQDGDTDVFINSGDSSENVTASELYLNDGNGDFTLDESFFGGNPPGQVHARKALTGDFNGDGAMDIFVVGHGYDREPFPGEAPYVILSGSQGYTLGTGFSDYVGFHHAAASADLDNDGDLDILVADNNTPAVFYNDGKGNFTKNTSVLKGLNDYNWFTTELLDVDGDGYVDILAAGHEQDGFASQVIWGDSSGIYRSSNATVLPATPLHGTVLDIDVADLDGDGDLDIVLNRTGDRTGSVDFYQGYYLQLLINEGGRKFKDESDMRLVTGRNDGDEWFDWIRLVDFDSDGDIDIVVDDASRDLVWYNDSVGNFQ
ncbi:FG-GAP repeat domain-containing protein [Alteromonas aestuariivivens]|nr:VCBS repeat-containing protein [Alteromonas aestuariivivens]